MTIFFLLVLAYPVQLDLLMYHTIKLIFPSLFHSFLISFNVWWVILNNFSTTFSLHYSVKIVVELIEEMLADRFLIMIRLHFLLIKNRAWHAKIGRISSVSSRLAISSLRKLPGWIFSRSIWRHPSIPMYLITWRPNGKCNYIFAPLPYISCRFNYEI